MTEDREIQKQIAEEAQTESATAASPAVRALQFFLVPLAIVGVCVLIYAFLSYLVASPRSAREWLKDIDEGGPNTRQHATLQLVQAIRRMKEPDAILTTDVLALFRRTPQEPDPEKFNMRRYLANCLGLLRDPRACEILLESVRGDRNIETRAACLDALGAIKDPDTLPDLVKLLDDPDGVIRKYAAFNAGAVAEETRDPAVVEALRKKLPDPRPDVGWNAALALAYFLGDGSGTDTLKKMLDRKYLTEIIEKKDSHGRPDPNAELLIARAMVGACNAAAKLKDETFLPLLQALTDDKKERDSDVRFIAHQAIAKIQRK